MPTDKLEDAMTYRLLPPFGRRLMLAGGGLFLAGCDLLSTRPTDSQGGGSDGNASRTPSGNKEAPSLAKRAQTGQLPPVDQRLPPKPVVLRPVESAGVYGGTWNTCNIDTGAASVYEKIGYEQLTRWDTANPGKVLPNLLRSWDLSDDGLTYTLNLVKGVRWSDGEPFDADDLLFAYRDVLQNTELYPVFPAWLEIAGRPGVIKKVDSHTITLAFEKPHALLPKHLAKPSGNMLCSLPRHYLKKFHKSYNSQAPHLARQQGFSDWTNLFFAKGGEGLMGLGAWQNTDLPTLLPWKLNRPLGGSGRVVAERNPYYWKTDPQGRQLPYLDRVVIKLVQTAEVAVLQATHGDYSLPTSDALSLSNKPVLARSRSKSHYHFTTLATEYMNTAIVTLNQTVKDPDLRKVFRNKDFRIGLSHAINRQEIIDSAYQRQGQPWQAAPRPESPFFDKRMAKQYTEYDLDRANAHLDRAGYSGRDDDGYRLGPGGKRISFSVDIPIAYNDTWEPVAELLRGYWKKVGVQLRIKSDEVSLFFNRTGANQHDATIYAGEYGRNLGMLQPKWYMPLYNQSFFATDWGIWYDSRHQSGQRPPAAPRHQMELYDRLKTTVDDAERARLFSQILRIARDEFYVIGTALPTDGYNIVKDDFVNVPEKLLNAWLWVIPGSARPEQFFTKGQPS